MPRLPVDGKKVIEHRITFGTKERDMLEGALGGYQFNKVATPVVAGMSDVSFMITLAGILAIYFPAIVIPTGKETMEEIIQAITQGVQDSIKLAKESAGDIILDPIVGKVEKEVTNTRESIYNLEPTEVRDERATSVVGGTRNLVDQILWVLTGGPIRRGRDLNFGRD